MEDEKIIELFFERSQQAITELDKKYKRLCLSISFNILNNINDAEECVNDAYMGVWNTIPPKKPSQLLSYVVKIVRNTSLNVYYRNNAAKRNSTYIVALHEIEECIPDWKTVESEAETKETARLIEKFLDEQNVSDRVIFMRRYAYCDTYAHIAKHMGITEKNVSVRLTRIRKKLRKYLSERGVQL